MKHFFSEFKTINIFIILFIIQIFFSFTLIKLEMQNSNNLKFYQPIIQRQQIPKILIKINDVSIKYKVEKGDTLYGIAKKFNTTIDNLKKLNNLNDKSILKVGMILIISSNNFLVYSPFDIFNVKLKTDKILLIYSNNSIIFSPLADGIISFVGEISGFGKSVIIQYNNYSVVVSNIHETFVEKGQKVNLQTCIGFSSGENVLNLSVFLEEKMLSLKDLLNK